MNYAALIKEMVSTPELFAHYGFERNEHGFICCPFHAENTPSMRVYDGQRGYYCFGCGANGDIITFLQRIFGLSFSEALAKINDDFHLGLPLRGETDTKRYARRIAKVEATKKERRLLEEEYDKTLSEWVRCDEIIRRCVPKASQEAISPEYAEALKHIDYWSYKLDAVCEKLFQFKRSNKGA